MEIKQEHKDIIGTLKEDGSFGKWPALNINGGRYNKPATTQKISDAHFVVLPASFKDWDAVKALKEQYGGVVISQPVVDFTADTFADAPPAGEFTGEEFGSIKRGKR